MFLGVLVLPDLLVSIFSPPGEFDFMLYSSLPSGIKIDWPSFVTFTSLGSGGTRSFLPDYFIEKLILFPLLGFGVGSLLACIIVALR
jgi:hypothetical protein